MIGARPWEQILLPELPDLLVESSTRASSALMAVVDAALRFDSLPKGPTPTVPLPGVSKNELAVMSPVEHESAAALVERNRAVIAGAGTG